MRSSKRAKNPPPRRYAPGPPRPACFCPLPWSHISVKGNGIYRLCCHSNISKSRGVLKDRRGRPFHVESASWEEVLNSETLKAVRKKMLAGVWPESCVRCEKELKAGLKPRNFQERALMKEAVPPEHRVDYEKAAAWTGADGSIPLDRFPVSLLDVRFGNLCNLRCAMCSPTDSSAWYREHQEIWGPLFEDSGQIIELKGGQAVLAAPSESAFSASPASGEAVPAAAAPSGTLTASKERDVFNWNGETLLQPQIEARLHQIRRIYIAGGEPLLMKEYYNLLEKCVKSGAAERLMIEFNSNITSLPEKALRLWKYFRRVTVGISIDGKGAVNDFIRYPSRWGRIEENLQKLDESGASVQPFIAMSCSALNIHHLPDFLDFLLKKNYRKIGFPSSSLVTPHPVHRPHFLNPCILEESYKEKVADRFQEAARRLSAVDWQAACGPSCVASWERKTKRASSLLLSYAKLMRQNPFSSKETAKWRRYFIHYMDRLDELRARGRSGGRGLRWKHVFPELYESAAHWRAGKNQGKRESQSKTAKDRGFQYEKSSDSS